MAVAAAAGRSLSADCRRTDDDCNVTTRQSRSSCSDGDSADAAGVVAGSRADNKSHSANVVKPAPGERDRN